jgi:GntR family transcriptional regulator
MTAGALFRIDIMGLNVDRKTPKYDIIYREILRKIEAGEWSPGDRLPSEATLANEHDVSLGTVQRSLRILEAEGLVVRRHGSGTYVAAALPTQNEILVHFFVADGKPENQSKPLPLYLKILDITSMRKRGPWTRFLGHNGETIKIERIINVNLEFQLYTELYLERERFKHLLEVPKHQLDGPSLFRRMYDTRQLPPRRFLYEMWLATPPENVVPHIRVTPDMPCTHWETLAFGHRDAPLFYSIAYIPPTNRRLRMDVSPRFDHDKMQYSAELERARQYHGPNSRVPGQRSSHR